MTMALHGKVAFITGGARGLGKAFAEALLDRGAKVSLADINTKLGNVTEKDLKSKYGGNSAIFSKCDVTSVEDLRACYKKTIDTFGGLDVVINNAGIMNEDNFEQMIDINLTAIIRSSYIASNYMTKDKGGKGGIIINVSSASGMFPSPFLLTYTGVKHGVIGFSRAMALNVKDFDKFGLRVAALCPSFAETDMIDPKNIHRETSRPDDMTQPNMEESAHAILQGVKQMGIMDPKTVVDGMLELVSEPKCNGAVLSITPEGTKYIHPKKLANKL